MRKAIKINDIFYDVLEDLGYQPSAGAKAKEVRTPDGPRMAILIGGSWRWWTVRDRLQPSGSVAAENTKLWSADPHEM
jgi:hypothetical protein